MKLDDIREQYWFYSGKASDISRQLALAGIGVVWIFKVDQPGLPKIPDALRAPMAFLVLALFFDFFQ